MSQAAAIDILILSNGPGEVTTWVRPVVKALRQQLGPDRDRVRLSLVLSPCTNASGREVTIAQTLPELDRIQGAEHFFPFLLWGKTAESWDWRDRGVVVFLGGDQLYPVIVGHRLGYRTVLYGEWDTRWHRWIDRFGVMNADLMHQAPARFADKFTVVGDLMADVAQDGGQPPPTASSTPLIGILPGSKPAKLAQGVPLTLAIARHIHRAQPHVQFAIAVAPGLDLATLATFAHAHTNPIAHYFGETPCTLRTDTEPPRLETAEGLRIALWTEFPAYEKLTQCWFCLTTVGANTAELGSLTIPMMVLLPTQQLDAMRAWDGIPGLLANLPGVGSGVAKLINRWFLSRSRLLAWPNIWAGEAIVPELVGDLNPTEVAALALDWLTHPEQLTQMRDRLRQVRGQPGAGDRLATLVVNELNPLP